MNRSHLDYLARPTLFTGGRQRRAAGCIYDRTRSPPVSRTVHVFVCEWMAFRTQGRNRPSFQNPSETITRSAEETSDGRFRQWTDEPRGFMHSGGDSTSRLEAVCFPPTELIGLSSSPKQRPQLESRGGYGCSFDREPRTPPSNLPGFCQST